MVFRRFLTLSFLVSQAEAANWAVLAAGSNWYSNYRHQADVCHSYAAVRSKGIPAENIILMMYDDVPYSEDNPLPGQLFNSPMGEDVYAICGPHIDYRGSDVNPQNFLGVLTGEGTGKVLRSTEEDSVFVFFVDHGGPGLICFPHDIIHTADLTDALQTMSDKKMFKKLVFYLETCDSGSMFQFMQIPGVYAVSAAGVDEPSWGTYCGAEVNGTPMYACLGDMFAVSWIENTEASDITQMTLDDQFTTVADEVWKSEVSAWGDQSFIDDRLSDFLGGSEQAKLKSTAEISADRSLWQSHSATLADLRYSVAQYEAQTSSEARLLKGLLLHDEVRKQVLVEHAFRELARIAYPDEASQRSLRSRVEQPKHRNCEVAGHRAFRQHCQGLFDAGSSFALSFHQIIVNLCHDIVDEGMNLDITMAAQMSCEGVASQSEDMLFGRSALKSASGLLV